jgi:hypothetical protein
LADNKPWFPSPWQAQDKDLPIVEGFFEFESGLNRKIIAKNCEIAENLKDGKGFIYKVVMMITEELSRSPTLM